MLTAESAMDVSPDSQEGWLKTKEPQSIKEWKWMAQHVWGTKYDFSTPLKLKKKQKRKSCVKDLQRNMCENPARSFEEYKKKRIQKKHKQELPKTKKQIQVFVHTPLSTTLNLTVDRLAEVNTVKDLLSERLGIAAEKQDLFAGSLKMCNLLTLEDHGVGDQSNITLKLCQGLLGGADKPQDSSSSNSETTFDASSGPVVNIDSGNLASAASSSSASNVLLSDQSNATTLIQKKIIGDHNIVVDTGSNSTVNIGNPQEVYEIKIRLTKVEEENEALRRQVQVQAEQAQRFESFVTLVIDRWPELAKFFSENGGRLKGYGHGSVYLFVCFSQSDQLDKLWRMYEDGSLWRELTRILLSEEGQRETANLDMEVFIDEADYLQGIKLFETQNVKDVDSSDIFPPSMNDWTSHHVRQFLLQQGISEDVAKKMFDEEVDGGVFVSYTAEEMVEDFQLKKGPLRKILKARDVFLSRVQDEKKPVSEKLTSSLAQMGIEQRQSGQLLSEAQGEEKPSTISSVVASSEGSSSVNQKSPDMTPSESIVSTANFPYTSSKTGAKPKKKGILPSQTAVSHSSPSVDSEAEKNLRKHLLSDDNLNLDASFFPILVANKPLPHATECSKEFEDCFSFISTIKWSVVMDFNAESNESGLASFYRRKCKARWQLSETLESTNLNESDVPLWIFSNGRQDDMNLNSPHLPRQEWREQRRESVENVISKFANPSVIPTGRAVIIFLILSDDDIGILSDAFSKFYTAFHGMSNITCLCADESLYDMWVKVASQVCGGPHVLRDNSFVGVPWSTINKFMRRMANATEATTFILPNARVPVDERKLQSWTDISVVCKNECENTDMDENNLDFKGFLKKKELEFYRGHKVQWWNFALTDQDYNQVLKRTVYDTLTAKVNRALQAGSDLVEVITIYHQTGSGGTTLGRHILWEFHKDYRCAVVNGLSSPDTAKQILELRKFNYTSEKECQPVLVLADELDDTDLDQLQYDLETFSKDTMTRRATAVILQCKRTSEPQIVFRRECKSGSGVTVHHELDERERDWFKKKHIELERNVRTSNDYEQKKLIGFMAMKSEFNPEYFKDVVSEVLPDLQRHSEQEYKLLTYTALVNSCDADAVIPVCSCDEFMAKDSPRDRAKLTPWEKDVSGYFNLLTIVATVYDQNIGEVNLVKGVKLVSQGVAEEITSQLADEKDPTLKPLSLAALTAELLHSPILGSQAYTTKRYLRPKIHNLLVQRKMAAEGMRGFSDLIERILRTESYTKALSVLYQGYQILNDPICAQQAARVCIKQQDYEKAHHYIDIALTSQPTNSYFHHTKGEIFKNEIREINAQYSAEGNKTRLPIDETRKICRLGFSAIDAFKECQKCAEEENRDNLYGCFGEVEISFTILDIIYRMEPFSGTGPQEQLKNYLLTETIPDGLEVLNEFHSNFKELKNNIDKALAEIENYTTLFKGKHRSRVDVKQLDLRQQKLALLKGLRKDYAKFFGAPLKSTPPENAADLAEWKRGIVVSLGADSFYDIFELASDRYDEENRSKLRKAYKLLSEIKPPKYKDLLQLICSILALCCMDVDGTEELPAVDKVYELVRQLNEQSDSRDIYGPFFRLLFLWPHPHATSHRLKQSGELRRCADDLRNRWDKKTAGKQSRSQSQIEPLNQNQPTRFKQRPSTFFFLANGEGLRQFAHIHELMNATQSHLDSDRDQFWKQSDVKERLTLLTGTLYSNTLLSYKTPTGELIRIALSKPKPCGSFSQEQVEFYLGFSFNGPRAYNVKYIEPVEEEQVKQGAPQLTKKLPTSVGSAKISKRIKDLKQQKMELERLQEKKKTKRLNGREMNMLKKLPKINSDLKELGVAIH